MGTTSKEARLSGLSKIKFEKYGLLQKGKYSECDAFLHSFEPPGLKFPVFKPTRREDDIDPKIYIPS